jgi:hypothetical protein
MSADEIKVVLESSVNEHIGNDWRWKSWRSEKDG